MNDRIRKIVIAGVMGGISIFLGATRLGFIPYLTGVSLTIMHVPVIIGAVLEGPVVGAVIGFIFGIFSLLQAALTPAGVDVVFINPLVSVLPRLFIGPVAWLVFRSSENLKKSQIFIISGFIGVVVNTVLWLLYERFGGFTSDIKSIFTVGISCLFVTSVSSYLLLRLYEKSSQLFPYIISALAGSTTNTALVLMALGLLKFLSWKIIGTIALFNGLPEAVIASLLAVVVVASWKGIETGKKGSSI